MKKNHAEPSQITRCSAYVPWVALVAAAGGFIWGYDLVIMSSAILFPEEFVELVSSMKGLAMSSATMGILIGVCLGGSSADWIGRRMSLISAAILFTVSAVGTAIPIGFID